MDKPITTKLTIKTILFNWLIKKVIITDRSIPDGQNSHPFNWSYRSETKTIEIVLHPEMPRSRTGVAHVIEY